MIEQRVPKEFFCHLCCEWVDVQYCSTHFDAHGSNGMTIETLEKRMAQVGGLLLRERVVESTERKQKNWLFQDEDDESVFVTNNFRHEGIRR